MEALHASLLALQELDDEIVGVETRLKEFDPKLAEYFLVTGPDGFRELLRDHQQKSKKLRELQESLRTL